MSNQDNQDNQAKQPNKSKKVTMSKRAFVAEHQRLIRELTTHGLKAEARDQLRELNRIRPGSM